jgi:hypothetical protein
MKWRKRRRRRRRKSGRRTTDQEETPRMRFMKEEGHELEEEV